MNSSLLRTQLAVGLLLLSIGACDRINDKWNYYKHGDKVQVGKMSIFHQTSVTRDEVRRLGNYLNKKFGGDQDSISVKVLKNGQTYEVYFVVKEGAGTEQELIQAFKLLGDELSRNVFQFSKTDIHLADDSFETIRVAPCLSCYSWVEKRARVRRDSSRGEEK